MAGPHTLAETERTTTFDSIKAYQRKVYYDGRWAPRYALRPLTKYERRGLAAGRTIRDLAFRRA